jgi:hypothetical protein
MNQAFASFLYHHQGIQDWWANDENKRQEDRIQAGDPDKAGLRVGTIRNLLSGQKGLSLVCYFGSEREIWHVWDGFNPFVTREYRLIPNLHQIYLLAQQGVMTTAERNQAVALLGFDGRKHGRMWDFVVR